MSWSTTAPKLPEGVSWSSYKTGARDNDHSNPNYDFRVRSRIARGPDNTVYVHTQLQAILRVYGATASIGQLRGQVKVGSGSEMQSSAYSGSNSTYEAWFVVKNVYWTGTADAEETITVWAAQGNNQSPSVSFTAPDYVTTYPVTYNGNGADGGETEAQEKIYDTPLTVQECGFTKANYAFDHWNTDPDDSGTSYAPGDEYNENSELTLYAIWAKTNIPVFVNVAGEIHQVERVYANVGGVIKECDVYANVGGSIRFIR